MLFFWSSTNRNGYAYPLEEKKKKKPGKKGRREEEKGEDMMLHTPSFPHLLLEFGRERGEGKSPRGGKGEGGGVHRGDIPRPFLLHLRKKKRKKKEAKDIEKSDERGGKKGGGRTRCFS